MWPRSTVGWIERGAAIAGVILLGLGARPWLLGRPAIKPDFAHASLSVLARHAFEIRLPLSNTNDSTAVRIVAASEDDGLSFADDGRLVIKPGASADLVIRGQAGEPGAQVLAVRLLARGGLLSPFSSEVIKIPVSVWPDHRPGRFSPVKASADWALVSARLEMGVAAPQGIACEATLPEIDRPHVDLIAAAPSVSVEDMAQALPTPHLTWVMAAAPAFTPIDVYLFLRLHPRGRIPDWSALSARIIWSCAAH